MAEILLRWEWRTFRTSRPQRRRRFDAMTPTSVERATSCTCYPRRGHRQVRDGLMDIKVLRETNMHCFQREPILKAQFPLDAAAARTAFEGLLQRRFPPFLPMG